MVPVALAAVILAAGLIVFASFIGHYTPRSDDVIAAQPDDGIVVLTGGERRVGEGLRLLGEGRARRVLVSGVHGQTTRDDLRRGSSLDAELFNCCVDVGYAAQDTIGNADEARAWVGTWRFRRLVVVTSNYHMPRALVELARALPEVELVPHPVVSRTYRAQTWWLHPRAARIVIGEYLKFLPAVTRLGLARVLPAGLPIQDADGTAPADGLPSSGGPTALLPTR